MELEHLCFQSCGKKLTALTFTNVKTKRFIQDILRKNIKEFITDSLKHILTMS